MSWLNRRVNVGVDKWFFWGAVCGLFAVFELTRYEVPGFGIYSWLIPLWFGLRCDEDTWFVFSLVALIGPSLVASIVETL